MGAITTETFVIMVKVDLVEYQPQAGGSGDISLKSQIHWIVLVLYCTQWGYQQIQYKLARRPFLHHSQDSQTWDQRNVSALSK